MTALEKAPPRGDRKKSPRGATVCVYLILAFMKFMAQIDLSISKILRLLQLNLFERRDLIKLLKYDAYPHPHPDKQQLCLI